MALDIGIDAKTRKKVAGALEQVLADTYSLYAKTHGYHWNVEGPRFLTLHTSSKLSTMSCGYRST
jgi:starvation-inducible DNA-binding protein